MKLLLNWDLTLKLILTHSSFYRVLCFTLFIHLVDLFNIKNVTTCGSRCGRLKLSNYYS